MLSASSTTASTVIELPHLTMDLKGKLMQYLAALSVLILSINAQMPEHQNYHQQQRQQNLKNHKMKLEQNNHHQFHQLQYQHRQYQQQNHQQQQQQQNHQQQQQQQNQQGQKHFHVKAQANLDASKKQKYQQEKFSQLIQKQMQNYQLGPKPGTTTNLPTLQKEDKTPLGRQRLPLPLVLSPENLHAMDMNPAITVVEPPKSLAESEQKKTSDLKKRQSSNYDAAIASLFREALNVAGKEPQALPLGSLNPAASKFAVLPLLQPQPIFNFKPIEETQAQIVQNPRPFHLPQLSDGLKTHQPIMSSHYQQFEQKNEEAEEEEDEEEEQYQNYAAKYKYGYRVVNDHEGSDFGQTESRDGDMTTGHYHVLLPDGRMQRVKYWSDKSGFHAQISYDRDAVHI